MGRRGDDSDRHGEGEEVRLKTRGESHRVLKSDLDI